MAAFRPGSTADRLTRLRDAWSRVVDTVLDGSGATSAEARRAAFAGQAENAAVTRYVDLVRRHAYRVTEDHVEGLRAAGLNDDAIFELTVAAALGAELDDVGKAALRRPEFFGMPFLAFAHELL